MLNKNSWFVRYWVRWGCTRYGYESMIREGTNLCQLARVMIYASLKSVFVTALVFMFVDALWMFPIQIFLCLFFSVTVMSAAIGLVWLCQRTVKKVAENKPFKDSLVVKYYGAWKGKYCPMIGFD